MLTAVKLDPEMARRSEARKDWAIKALTIGGAVMTALSMYAMFLLTQNPRFVFWLGLAAHIEVLIVLTGLSGLLVKRSLKLDRSGVQIIDYDKNGHSHDDLIEREDAEEAIESVPAKE